MDRLNDGHIENRNYYRERKKCITFYNFYSYTGPQPQTVREFQIHTNNQLYGIHYTRTVHLYNVYVSSLLNADNKNLSRCKKKTENAFYKLK